MKINNESRIVIYNNNNNVHMNSSSYYPWWYTRVWLLGAFTILMIVFAVSQPQPFFAFIILLTLILMLIIFVWAIVKSIRRSDARAQVDLADEQNEHYAAGYGIIDNNNNNINRNSSYYSWRYTGVWVLLMYAILMTIFAVIQPQEFLGLILLIALIAMPITFVRMIVKSIKRHNALAKADARAIRARADDQNERYLAGSDRGIYGDYTPYTMPIPDAGLDNYDDGLHRWK